MKIINYCHVAKVWTLDKVLGKIVEIDIFNHGFFYVFSGEIDGIKYYKLYHKETGMYVFSFHNTTDIEPQLKEHLNNQKPYLDVFYDCDDYETFLNIAIRKLKENLKDKLSI